MSKIFRHLGIASVRQKGSQAHFKEAKQLCIKGRFDVANELLLKLAAESHPTARLWLAHNRRFGYGFIPNQKKAIVHYQKAAELGEWVAQYELAMAYFDGVYIEENLTEGWRWLLKSAVQGYSQAAPIHNRL